MMKLFQPPVMNDSQFDHAMKEMDIEMVKLKEIMEAYTEEDWVDEEQPAHRRLEE